MLKTKIKIILPIWLTLLVAVCAIDSVAILLQPKIMPTENLSLARPQVLGAATDIRGEQATPALPELKQVKTINDETVQAKSFLGYDLSQDRILAEKNPASPMPVASLTKLLTALIVYEKSNLSEKFVVQQTGPKVKPSLGLSSGDEVTVMDLFKSMLIGSCNDAAAVLADYIERSTNANFADLMNKKAESLQMTDSFFTNPMGFDYDNNHSSARDLLKLVKVIEKLSIFESISRSQSYEFTSLNGKKFTTQATNKLLGKYDDIQAIKTGFTETAQGSMITKIPLNGHQIILIILGSPDREDDTLRLKRAIESSYL